MSLSNVNFNTNDISIFKNKVEQLQSFNNLQHSIESEYYSANLEKIAFSIRSNNNFKTKFSILNNI